MPSKQNDRFRAYFDLSVQVVRRIMAQRESAPIEESDRDVLSVLREWMVICIPSGLGADWWPSQVRANAAEDASKRLTDTELIAQLTSVCQLNRKTSHADDLSSLLIIAGHDTTAATLTWLLWELAKHPKAQDRIRVEVREARKSGSDFTGPEYDSMTYLNASIKVHGHIFCCCSLSGLTIYAGSTPSSPHHSWLPSTS